MSTGKVDVCYRGELLKGVPLFSRLSLDSRHCEAPGCGCDSTTLTIACKDHQESSVVAIWCKSPGVLMLVCAESGCNGVIGALRCGADA